MRFVFFFCPFFPYLKTIKTKAETKADARNGKKFTPKDAATSFHRKKRGEKKQCDKTAPLSFAIAQLQTNHARHRDSKDIT